MKNLVFFPNFSCNDDRNEATQRRRFKLTTKAHYVERSRRCRTPSRLCRDFGSRFWRKDRGFARSGTVRRDRSLIRTPFLLQKFVVLNASFSTLPRNNKKHSFLNGCAFSMQVWAFEHIPIAAPLLSNLSFPSLHRWPHLQTRHRKQYEARLQNCMVIERLQLTKEELAEDVVKEDLYKTLGPREDKYHAFKRKNKELVRCIATLEAAQKECDENLSFLVKENKAQSKNLWFLEKKTVKPESKDLKAANKQSIDEGGRQGTFLPTISPTILYPRDPPLQEEGNEASQSTEVTKEKPVEEKPAEEKPRVKLDKLAEDAAVGSSTKTRFPSHMSTEGQSQQEKSPQEEFTCFTVESPFQLKKSPVNGNKASGKQKKRRAKVNIGETPKRELKPTILDSPYQHLAKKKRKFKDPMFEKEAEVEMPGPFHKPKRPLLPYEIRVLNEHWYDPEITKSIIIDERQTLSLESLQTLKGDRWLDGEVINAYMKLLKRREDCYKDSFVRCHFFPTYYPILLKHAWDIYHGEKLDEVDHANWPQFSPNLAAYTAIDRVEYKITDCEKLFLPYHDEAHRHWALFIIDMKEKRVDVLDSLGPDRMVQYMDFIFLMKSMLPKVLVHYGHDHINLEAYTFASKNDIPYQQNGHDCGMFVCKYMDYSARGLAYDFCKEEMAYFRQRAGVEIVFGVALP